ncbi:MAG: NUDIX domain-containing protein [Candidatus Andersenbacteria bacterium]
MSNNLQYIVNVEAAIYQDGKWLLIKRSDQEEHAAGELALVSGKVEGATDEQDILEETVQREVREEVGIRIEVRGYVESHAFIVGDKHVIDIVMLCSHVSGEATPQDPAEVASVHWMTAQEVEASDAAEWVKNSVRLATLKL